MKKKLKIIIGVILGLILIFIGSFYLGTRPLKNDGEDVFFTIEPGQNKLEIVSNLKDANIVRSKLFTLIYVVLKPNCNLQAGEFKINRASSSIEVIDQISSGNTRIEADTTRITFIEGKRVTDYAKEVAKKFAITEKEFLNKINDAEFIEQMQNKYSFLTDEIENEKIYYSLEGYLAPDTYEFYANTTAEEIIDKMLANMANRLNKIDYKNSKYSLHEILTIASIAELEAINDADRKMVSQVIYKRLNINMPLGMDVTTYYGAQVEMGDAINMHLNDVNGYNTRNNNFYGLPVGPICNPSLESINAALNPADTDYLYFAADVNTMEVYFGKDEKEFYEILKALGLR